jgi:dynein heavy chain
MVLQSTSTEGDRVQILIENITEFIFKTICRGLYIRHKRIFSFLLTYQFALQNDPGMSPLEWKYMVNGVFINGVDFQYPVGATFNEQAWQSLCMIVREVPAYSDILKHMQKNV